MYTYIAVMWTRIYNIHVPVNLCDSPSSMSIIPRLAVKSNVQLLYFTAAPFSPWNVSIAYEHQFFFKWLYSLALFYGEFYVGRYSVVHLLQKCSHN